jgi:hypothetical protein
MTLPLLPLVHDWSSAPVVERTWPTSVLPRRDGTEQRLGLAATPIVRVTYRFAAFATAEAARVAAFPRLGLDEDLRCRVPRWEEQVRLAAAVDAGATALPCILAGGALDTDFAVAAGDEVLLVHPPTAAGIAAEVVTVDAVTASALTLVAPGTAQAWGAGTIVVPLAVARLVAPLELTRYRDPVVAPAWTFELETRDVAGVGAGGSPVMGQAAAISVSAVTPSGWVLRGSRAMITATVTDAAGNLLAPTGLVWASAEPAVLSVRPTGTPGVALLRNERTDGSLGASHSVTITASIGAVSVLAAYDARW